MEYDIVQKPPQSRRENAEYYIVPVYRETVDEERMAETIVEASSLTRGDVLATISALTEETASALASGHKVHIKGLGTFRLRLNTPKKDLKATDKVANRITVRDVAFTPEVSFMRRFCDVNFTRTDHSRTLRRVADSDAVVTKLRTFFASNEFLRRANVQSLASCSRTTACRLLTGYVEAGYLVNVGSLHAPLYRATAKLTEAGA